MLSILTIIWALIVGIIVLGFIAASAMFLIWWERKVSAHIQSRYGPMRVGWHGVLQSVADAVKLLLKENIIPAEADKLVWWLAPFIAVVPPVMAFVVLPFGKNLIVKDLNVGVLYLMALSSVSVIGIFMAVAVYAATAVNTGDTLTATMWNNFFATRCGRKTASCTASIGSN